MARTAIAEARAATEPTAPRGDEPRRRRIDRWLLASALAGAAVVLASYWRLYYGVDFADESYYTAVPLHFVLGARPFIDETTPSQETAGLLLYPFIAGYHALAGGTSSMAAGMRVV